MNIDVDLTNNETQQPAVYNDRPELDAFTLLVTADEPFPLDANTALEVSFPTNVLAAAAIAKIEVTGEDWTPQSQAGVPILGLAYAGQAGNATEISIRVTGISSKKAATHGDVSVTLYHGDDGEVTAGTKLVLQQFPNVGARDLREVVDFELTGLGGSTPARIERTPDWDPKQPETKVTNVVKFAIWNNGDKALLSGAKAQEWPGGTPTVRLSFAYGTGVGALTTNKKPASDHPFSAWGIKAKVERTQETGGKSFPWVPKNPRAASAVETPAWTVQPEATNRAVLGSGGGAFATFLLENVATQAPSGDTLMFISWTGFPGFNDGYDTLRIEKGEPAPEIMKFEHPLEAEWGKSFEVSWQARNVDRVLLKWWDKNDTGEVDSVGGEIDKNEGRFRIPKIQGLDDQVTVALTAYKDGSDIHENPAIGDVTVRFPELAFESFSVSPTRGILSKVKQQTVTAPKGAVAPVDLTLKWSINHPQLVKNYDLMDEHDNASKFAAQEGPAKLSAISLGKIEGSKSLHLRAHPKYDGNAVDSEDASIDLYPPAHGRVKVTAAPGTKSLLTRAKILVVARPDGGAPSCDLKVTGKFKGWAVSTKKAPAKPQHESGSTKRVALPKSFSGLPHVRVFGKGGDTANPEFVVVAVETLDRHLDGRKYRSRDGVSISFGPRLSMSCDVSRVIATGGKRLSQRIRISGRHKVKVKPQVKSNGQFLFGAFRFPVKGSGEVKYQIKVGIFNQLVPQTARATVRGSCHFRSLELLADGRLRARVELNTQAIAKKKKINHSETRDVILDLVKEPRRPSTARRPPPSRRSARKATARKATARRAAVRRPPPSRPAARAGRPRVRDHRRP